MKTLDVVPAMLFGVALGAIVVLGVRDPQRLPASLMPSLATAMTTVIVGWWIHTAVRQRGVLDRIQIEYIADINRRIRDLIAACFSATDEERVVPFRQLSIEINHLREIARRTQPDELHNLQRALFVHYIIFKKNLTDSDAVDKGFAWKASGRIRMTALKIEWHLCKQLLEATTDANIFPAD